MVDADTKIRQALFIVLSLVSLVLTLLLYFVGSEWLGPALASYAALLLLGVWGNSRITLVKYGNGDGGSADAS
jgi:hypothetical protein